MSATTPPVRVHLLELDALRMVAVAMMVANHAGVAWLPPDARSDGLSGALTFAGSFAPVMFFCVTGMGRGARSSAAPASFRRATWAKAGLLWLGDAAMWLSPQQWLGLDFLGFIALSSVAVDGLARRARWGLAAAALAFACLAVRFGVGPLLEAHLPGALESVPLRLVVGTQRVVGVSYPLSPWLVFPLLGMLAAFLGAPLLATARGKLLAGCAAAALTLAAACAVLDARGLVFFRWGTMSFAYFVASLGVIAVACAATLAVGPALRRKALRALLTIGGPASLFVVPVHYGLVAAVGAVWKPHAGGQFVLAMALTLVATVALARELERSAQRLALSDSRALVVGLWWIVAAGLGVAAAGALAAPRIVLEVPVQLAVAALFVRTSASPSRVSAA